MKCLAGKKVILALKTLSQGIAHNASYIIFVDGQSIAIPADLSLWSIFNTQTLVFYTRARKVVLSWWKAFVSFAQNIDQHF